MKYLAYIFIFTIFVSCDNELNVVEDFKDIPVVYGFLSLSDTAQYIRVERAFIDESTSGLELAKIPDSLYYNNATVTIEHVRTSTQYEMTRVDGNLEGYVREDGVFAQSPNYLYKLKNSEINLIPEEEYKFILNRGDGSELIETSTILVGESDLKVPNVTTGQPIAFNSIDFTNMIWAGSPAAKIYNVIFDFNYQERELSSATPFEKKSVSWQAVRNFKTDEENGRVNVQIEGTNFYAFLKGAIEENPNIERRFDNLSIRISGGGEEIDDFVQIGSANLGITSTQDPPFFSNIEGGRGLFSSTYDLVLNDVAITNQTLDSIKDGQFTKDLGFR